LQLFFHGISLIRRIAFCLLLLLLQHAHRMSLQAADLCLKDTNCLYKDLI
jgi:hypothetical protein